MKRYYQNLMRMGMMLALLTAGLAYTQNVDAGCLEHLRLLLTEYEKVVASEALTIHYHQWQEQAGEVGSKMEHWMWIKGDRMRYENADYGFIQDARVQVVIDHSSRTVLLQDRVAQDNAQADGMRGFMELPVARQADSIAAIASSIRCEALGRIRIVLPPRIAGKQQPVKSLVWEYDPLGRRLIRQVCTYYGSEDTEGEYSDVYLYDELSPTVADRDLPMDALSLVYAGSAVLPAYAGYEIVDLRSKQ